MRIILNSSSMIPIWEQLAEQIKKLIVSGKLSEGESLPSVRGLANELRISALTVKKSYDYLEKEGYVKTVHGKGTYVLKLSPSQSREVKLRQFENDLELLISKASLAGIEKQEIRAMLDLLLEETNYDKN